MQSSLLGARPRPAPTGLRAAVPAPLCAPLPACTGLSSHRRSLRVRASGGDPLGSWDDGDTHELPSNADPMKEAPQVRVRVSADKAREQLFELAALNERLSGVPPHKVRQQLEYLKMRRRNWEDIYNYVTAQDAEVTLALIEDASKKVEEALNSKDAKSIGELKTKLTSLKREVEVAHDRLHVTQGRVEQNLKRVEELKAEALNLQTTNNLNLDDVAEPGHDALSASFSRRTGGAAAVAAPEDVGAEEATTTAATPEVRTATPSRSPRGPGDAKRSNGLDSSMDIEPGLRQFWYPVSFSKNLTADKLIPFELLDMPWVLFRDENGAAAALHDQCAHRACPLSLGKVEEGKVACPYHGWKFEGNGDCTDMPSTVFVKGVGVSSLPVVESDGLVWVWTGDVAPEGEHASPPSFAAVPEGFQCHAEIEVEVPVEHGLLMENLLDLAHAPFTHTSTFAKGWPIPDFVRFQMAEMLGGRWNPYPIDMSFEPPCMVLSTIGLTQPGKIDRGLTASQCQKHLHQLHVCLPSKRGHTRLLYRMSLDFLPWARFVPFIDLAWERVAAQVLGEDLVLVLGQQERLQRGGNTWATPVPYDKLAVRYRRWRNSVDDAAPGDKTGRVKMNAGDMFSVDEDDN